MGSAASAEIETGGTPFQPKKLLSVKVQGKYLFHWLVTDEYLVYLEQTLKNGSGIKDTILVDMLNGPENSRTVSYCVTDPDLEDNPIIFCSDAFFKYLGYEKEEVEGRNCRFLQGAQTDPGDVAKIREAVNEKKEASLCLLNYKKDGSTFHNQLFLTPIFDGDAKLAYFLGVQVQVKDKKEGHEPENPAWVYTLGLLAA